MSKADDDDAENVGAGGAKRTNNPPVSSPKQPTKVRSLDLGSHRTELTILHKLS